MVFLPIQVTTSVQARFDNNKADVSDENLPLFPNNSLKLQKLVNGESFAKRNLKKS